MELVPNQNQAIELDTIELYPTFSANTPVTGVIPLIGGTHADKFDHGKLRPLDESPHVGPTIRRPSQVSVRPSSIINFPYSNRQSISILPAPLPSPSESESGKSLHGSESKEERRLPAEVRSKREAWRARVYYASQCFSLFLGGWNDSATVSLHSADAHLS